MPTLRLQLWLVATLAFSVAFGSEAAARSADKVLMQKRESIIDETIMDLETEFVSKELSLQVHDKQMGPVMQQLLKQVRINEWLLSLRDCTGLVLEQNSDIKISYLDVDTAKRSVKKEQADFYPTTSADVNLSRTRTPAADGTEVISVGETVNTNAGIDIPLLTGGTVSIDFDVDRSGRKHAFTSDLTFTATQPIFEGFGLVNLADIRVARNNFDIALQDLKNSIINEISTAQTAYWEILNASEVLKARELAAEQASDLVDQSKREMELGKRTITDILQAEATAASREEQVLQAENTLRNQEDSLKEILNIQATSLWNKSIIVTEQVDPEFTPINLDLGTHLESAFQSRPDYKQIFERLNNDEISMHSARNGLLPDVSVDATYNLNGAGGSTRNSVDSMFSHNYADWGVGASVSMPWLDISDRETYQQEKNDLKKRNLQIKNLQLQIIREVRAAVRAVKTNIKRVKAANLAYELQAKKLEAAQKKYSLGVASSFEVLEFQEDLVNASVSRIRAIVDYQQGLIDLWKTLGTTLNQNNITLD